MANLSPTPANLAQTSSPSSGWLSNIELGILVAAIGLFAVILIAIVLFTFWRTARKRRAPELSQDSMPYMPEGFSEEIVQLRRIERLIEVGQERKAKELLHRLLASNPNNARAWYLYSFVASSIAKQVKALEKALFLDPNYQDALRRLEELRFWDLGDSLSE